MFMPEHKSQPGAPPSGHETRDVSFRAVMIGGLAIGLAVGGLVVAADMLFPQKSLDRLLKPPFPVIAEPRLQSDPVADMAAFAAREKNALNSFGWTDTDRGIGHIPIDQAMQEIAREGIPGWPADAGAAP